MEHTPIRFVPETATREEWDRLHAYGRLHREQLGATGGAITDRVRETYMKGMEWEMEVVFVDDRIVSTRYFRLFEGKALHMSGGLLRAFRRRGIGTMWLRRACERMRDAGVEDLHCRCHLPDERQFLERVGFDYVKSDGHSELDLETLDWGMVRDWASGAAPGVRMEFFPERFPDERLIEYLSIRNLFPDLGQARETLEETRANMDRMVGPDGLYHTVLAVEEDGSVSGMTEMLWYPDRPEKAVQEFTGVAPDRRGRGIGKAVKAAMLEFVRDRHPELKAITTTNETRNAPMLSINERLGFRRTKETEQYRISKSDLEAWLASR